MGVTPMRKWRISEGESPEYSMAKDGSFRSSTARIPLRASRAASADEKLAQRHRSRYVAAGSMGLISAPSRQAVASHPSLTPTIFPSESINAIRSPEADPYACDSGVSNGRVIAILINTLPL